MRISSSALFSLIFTASAHLRPHTEPSDTQIIHKASLSSRCMKDVPALGNATVPIRTQAPYYQTFQNDTCIFSPEITAGPCYWPHSSALKRDMTENQGVMADLWHCNATGSYSSFSVLSPNTPFPELLAEQGKNISDLVVGTTDLYTDSETWLRGTYPTIEHGMMQMKTIFPGFYIERAIHIHVQVHADWTFREIGTLVLENMVNTGQLYLDEEPEAKIMAMDPYASHTEVKCTSNAENKEFFQGHGGTDYPVGLVGYITIVVDSTASRDEHYLAA
ncbi:Intradiol ring-cleavage dioxygenase [Aspergillus alliaceus]|uniref:Intradiol ring-cleavage dioxygenase n=1 Tax=Petromyces alliaceus TaxID=209559 RepID=A0A5N7CFH6_PETAA|nr:Intradiol ring-cleavage dioxygenase [Aspergillus alliaceus]